jgi:hypothetical protein
VSILGGDLVWVNGPYPCGDWPDISIFKLCLKYALDENERVEADDGYRGEDPEYVKAASGMVHEPEQAEMRSYVRRRHETVNKRLKQFACLSTEFHHDMAYHADCFRAVAVLTQLSIDAGLKLFHVDYDDAQLLMLEG